MSNPARRRSVCSADTNREKLLAWVAVAFLAVLVLLGRVPDLFFYHQDWDEAAMMSQSWAMTQGQVLYKNVPQVHPVLQFALFVPFFYLVGPAHVPLAIKAMNLVLVFVGALLVSRIASRWLGSPALGFLGGCIFVFYCSALWGRSSQGEFYTMFPILSSVWLLNFANWPRGPTYYWTGALWGVSFFLKQIAIFDAVGLYVGYMFLAQAPKQSKLAATGLMALGFLSVAAVSSIYFLYHGALPDAWHAMFVRSASFAGSGGGRVQHLLALARAISGQVGACLLAIPGIVYLILYQKDYRNHREAQRLTGAAFFVLLLIWLCADLLGLYVATGPKGTRTILIYQHYLLQVVPLVSLLPLFFLGQMNARMGNAFWVSLLLVITARLGLHFAGEMRDLAQEHWVPPPVRQSTAAANFISRHTRRSDPIFVYRADNLDVFFLSQRLSNNGIYMYIDMIEGSGQGLDRAELERKRREFLSRLPAVIVVDPTWTARLDFLEDALRRYYALETTVDGLQLYARLHRYGTPPHGDPRDPGRTDP